MFNVMIEHDSGTWCMRANCWERERTVTTWTSEKNRTDAEKLKAELLAGNPRNVVWIERR